MGDLNSEVPLYIALSSATNLTTCCEDAGVTDGALPLQMMLFASPASIFFTCNELKLGIELSVKELTIICNPKMFQL